MPATRQGKIAQVIIETTQFVSDPAQLAAGLQTAFAEHVRDAVRARVPDATPGEIALIAHRMATSRSPAE